MIELTKEEKRLIKLICRIFKAQGIWIDGVKVTLPNINVGTDVCKGSDC